MQDIEKLWQQAIPIILQSPITLFSIFMTFLMGYGISFLIFDFRREKVEISEYLHLFVGCGYAASIFSITNWSILINGPTLNDLANRTAQTFIVGFVILFFLFIIITIKREKQRRN